MSPEPLWEVQWHPGGGGRLRRWTVTRTVVKRLAIVAVAVAVLVLGILGILPLGLRGLFARFTVAAVRQENARLSVESEELAERAGVLVGAVVTRVQSGRRLAWMLGIAAPNVMLPALPVAADGRLAVVDWLERASPSLADLGDGLAAGALRPPCGVSALPTGAPVHVGRAVPIASFGWQTSPFTGKPEAHQGVTLAAPAGEAVLAAGPGTVLFAGLPRERKANEWSRFGTVIVIDHGGGVLTLYGHLATTLVRRGQTVARGQRVATVGQSGWARVPGLYYEVRWPVGASSRPIDPALLLFALPLADPDARFLSPAADLPDDFATLERLR